MKLITSIIEYYLLSTQGYSLYYLIIFKQVNRSLFGKRGSQNLCEERRFTRVSRTQSYRRALRGDIFLTMAERGDQQSNQNRF